MDILKENCICKNTMGIPLRYKERQTHTAIYGKDALFKIPKVKEINKPKIIKECDIFDFKCKLNQKK